MPRILARGLAEGVGRAVGREVVKLVSRELVRVPGNSSPGFCQTHARDTPVGQGVVKSKPATQGRQIRAWPVVMLSAFTTPLLAVWDAPGTRRRGVWGVAKRPKHAPGSGRRSVGAGRGGGVVKVLGRPAGSGGEAGR